MAEEALTSGSVTTPGPEPAPRPRGGRGRLRALRRDQSGQALVEFALVAPILFLLVFGILDFARLLNYYNQQTQLVGQGARAAAVSRCPDGNTLGTTCSSIQNQLVTTYATGGLQNNTTVCISGPNGNLPAVGQPVTVTASYKFKFLPLIGDILGSPTVTITASQSERQEAIPTYATGCS